MHIVYYPHPTLRHKSKSIRRVDAELRDIVAKMFELMYEAKGIGLAANQVDLPIRLFVVNLKVDSTEGEQQVFINPVINNAKGSSESEEGCLSLPGVYGDVKRPKQIVLNAYNLQGEEIVVEVEGLEARVFQHEVDHLDGVLFPDRMSQTGRMEIADELEDFELEFKSRRATGEIPSDEIIAARLVEIEKKYC